MSQRDVYEALRRYLDACAALATAQDASIADLRTVVAAAQLEYQNRLGAFVLKLKAPGRRTLESIERPRIDGD